MLNTHANIDIQCPRCVYLEMRCSRSTRNKPYASWNANGLHCSHIILFDSLSSFTNCSSYSCESTRPASRIPPRKPILRSFRPAGVRRVRAVVAMFILGRDSSRERDVEILPGGNVK